MAEFGFSAKVNADVSGFQKGMLKAEKSLNKFAKGIEGIGKKGIVGSLANITLAMGGVVTAFKTATKIVKEVAKAVGECTEAYKTQAIAERSLQTAIENNPYISGSSLNALKQFASEMQAVTNYGDEQILQLETQLVSLGRTEEETMKIIKVATDMASTGTMSLDTAITQLNATLNGNIGRLGQQNAELKGLTEEELKSGKAIDILGEKFKGLSSATIDTSKQLQNIKGDFKEAIGEFTLPSSDMWNKFWMGFYQKGIDVVHKLQASIDSSKGEGIYEKLAGSVKKIKNEEEKRRAINDALSMSNEVELNQLQTYLEGIKKRNKQEEMTLELVKQTLQYRKDAEEAVEKGRMLEEQDEAKRQKALDEQLEAENKIVKLKEEYLEKVAEQEAKWKNTETVTGEVVENEEKITFYQNALVDLMTQAGGQITTNNQLYKDQIAIIQKLQAEIQPEEKKSSDVWVEKIRQQAIERLEAEKDAYDQSVDLEKTTALERYQVRKELNDKIIELQKEQLLAEREKALKSVEGTLNEQEEKVRIYEYYNNEFIKITKQYATGMELQGKNAGTKFGEGFKQAVQIIKKVGTDIVKVCTGIVNRMKSIFSKVKNIFDFNPDSALDNLLIFEDKVLTFFVETLPKLPQFFASAIESISVLFRTLAQNISADFINGIIDGLLDNVDSVLNGIGKLLEKVIENLPNILGRIIGFITEYVPKIIDIIIKTIPSMLSSSGKIIESLLDGIATLIEAVVSKLPALLKTLIPSLVKSVVKIIPSIFKNAGRIISAVIKELPTIISAIIQGVAECLGNLKASDIAEIIKGIIVMTTQVASAIVKSLGKIVAELIPVMVQLIVELIKSIPDILEGLATGVWSGIKDIGASIWEGIKGVGEGIKNIGKSIVGGIKKIFGFATGTNNAPKGLAIVGEQGPELVRFKGGEKVYNATNTQKMLNSAGSSGNTFNVTFNNTQDTTAYAMMQQLRNYNRQMAINGVI